MAESSEDDPVAECVRRLQTNDESLKYLQLGCIIPEIYEDDESVNSDGWAFDYGGRFVDNDIVRIARALGENTVVEGFDLDGMRDKIGQMGALALGEAMSLNHTIAYVELQQRAFDHDDTRMALFLEGIARNKQSAVDEICIEAVDPAGHVVSALSKVLLKNRGQLRRLSLTEMHIDDKAGIALADGLRRQKNLATLEIKTGDSDYGLSCWAAYSLAKAVSTKTVLSEIEVLLPMNASPLECLGLQKFLSLNRDIGKFELDRDFSGENEDDDDPSLSDESGAALAEAFRHNVSASSLRIDLMSASASTFALLMPAILAPGTVTHLFMHSCAIYPSGAEAFANALKKDKKLVSLTLSMGQIGDYGAELLAEGLKGNATLKELAITMHRIGSTGMKHLADALPESHIEILDLNENRTLDLEPGAFRQLLGSNSKLHSFSLTLGTSLSYMEQPMNLSCFQAVVEILKTNKRIKSISLPVRADHISKTKRDLACMLRNNRTLEKFTLACAREDKLDEKQRAEIKSMMLEVLKENHILKSAHGYLELDEDEEIKRLLDLNKNGFFTAAALKGVHLPDSYVSNLADVVIPNAIARIGSKAGVGGIYSFLQQIHAVNTISAHQKFGPAKKRPRKQATIGVYFHKKK